MGPRFPRTQPCRCRRTFRAAFRRRDGRRATPLTPACPMMVCRCSHPGVLNPTISTGPEPRDRAPDVRRPSPRNGVGRSSTETSALRRVQTRSYSSQRPMQPRVGKVLAIGAINFLPQFLPFLSREFLPPSSREAQSSSMCRRQCSEHRPYSAPFGPLGAFVLPPDPRCQGSEYQIIQSSIRKDLSDGTRMPSRFRREAGVFIQMSNRIL